MENKYVNDAPPYQEVDTTTWRGSGMRRKIFKTLSLLTIIFFLSTQIDSRWARLNSTALAQDAGGAQPTTQQPTQQAEKALLEEEEVQTTQHLPSSELEKLFGETT